MIHMSSTIICTVGLSPPVITEGVAYLEGEGTEISNVVLIMTESYNVKKSGKIARAALINRFPNISVYTEWLPYYDVNKNEENDQFMRDLASIIKRRRQTFGDKRIIINLAGGRKGMTVAASIVGQLLEVNKMFHIVSKDVEVLNISLEKIGKEIEDLYHSNDHVDFYRKKKEIFDPVMFPEPSSYNVIDLITIPYPKEYLKMIMTLIRNDVTRRYETELSPRMLDALSEMGLISPIFDKQIVVTDKGRRLRNILL